MHIYALYATVFCVVLVLFLILHFLSEDRKVARLPQHIEKFYNAPGFAPGRAPGFAPGRAPGSSPVTGTTVQAAGRSPASSPFTSEPAPVFMVSGQDATKKSTPPKPSQSDEDNQGDTTNNINITIS
jgi:hypothetical protein